MPARPDKTKTASRSSLLIAIFAGVILDRMLLGHTELNIPYKTREPIPYLHHAALAARGEGTFGLTMTGTPAPGSFRKACGRGWPSRS